jgi:hydrogenase maturation protein HypF
MSAPGAATIAGGDTVVRRHVRVRGLVQGVGFRPFVHRLATERGLSGIVGNDTDGVFIEVQGSPRDVADFLTEVAVGPPLAAVSAVDVANATCRPDAAFTIVASVGGDAPATYVAPDAAVCDDCVAELFDLADRRYRYPFINCTNCGPRFTITTALPYDRATTTMAGFDLCPACQDQYADPADRRFHAQPLACAACGPRITLVHGDDVIEGTDAVIAAAQRLLARGRIIALKGIGGFHLACAAGDDTAVARLRVRKSRPHKPLAVMAADLATARELGHVDEREAALLSSPARPIVLLRRRESASDLAPSVSAGSPLVGVMLPYAPLHHLLFAPVPGHFAEVPGVLVMTSGNLSEEPICIDDADALDRLGGIADAFVLHDRPIHVACDDSVVRIVDGRVMPVRRSRGYVPMPVRLPVATVPTLAVGGEMKNTFCISRGRDAWLSQHIGDMGSVETLEMFEHSVGQFRSLYAIEPERLALDRHPGYHTTGWAYRSPIADASEVQHHHAHLAALLAEHDRPLDARIAAAVFDGTGYGDDGTIWGGEVLVGGYGAAERVAHLSPVSLPGGDATVRRPYRSALAHLAAAGIEWSADLPPVTAARSGELALLAGQIGHASWSVPCTSMGRLFDAVASLIGLRHEVTFEGQAAVELEHLAAQSATVRRYRFEIAGPEINTAGLLAAIVGDVRAGVEPSAIAAGFHDAVATMIADVARQRRECDGIDTVGLTGGVFQNAVLTAAARRLLEADGFAVLVHERVPPNDGGLALGQLAVAAARSVAPELITKEQ